MLKKENKNIHQSIETVIRIVDKSLYYDPALTPLAERKRPHSHTLPNTEMGNSGHSKLESYDSSSPTDRGFPEH